MSSYIYKNLLIVQRSSDHTPTVKHLRGIKVFFENKNVNLRDKIVLYYPKPFVPDNRVHVLYSKHFMYLIKTDYVGIMILNCDRQHNVTLLHNKFDTNENLNHCYIQIKEFLDKMKYTYGELNTTVNLITIPNTHKTRKRFSLNKIIPIKLNTNMRRSNSVFI